MGALKAYTQYKKEKKSLYRKVIQDREKHLKQ
jgi:hypothetical protein